jgi:5'-3' exonuclease
MSTKTIAIVDLGVWYQVWQGTAHLEASEAYKRTLDKVRGYASQADHCIVAVDSPPYFRSRLYPEYKSQRKSDTEVMRAQRVDVIEELRADGFYLLEQPGYEADDMMASAVAAIEPIAAADFKEYGDGYEVTLYTADKDMCALCAERPGWKVRVISTMTGKERDPVETWGVQPEQVPHLLAMAGDTADHVPGIRGIAEGKAGKLLRAGLDVPALVKLVSEKQPFEIAAELPEGMGEACAAAIVAAVTTVVEVDGQQMSSLERSLQLTTLRTDAPIDVDRIFAAREPLERPAGEDYGFNVDADYGMGGEPDPDPDITSVEEAALQSTVPPSSDPGEAPPSAPAAEPTQPSQPEPAAPPPSPRPRNQLEAQPDRAQAMVVHEAEWDTSFEPRNRLEAWHASKMVVKGRCYGLSGYGRPEQVMLAIMAGKQWGMSVVDSLNGFDIIEGRVAPRAQLAHAWCLGDPRCEMFYLDFEQCTDERAVVVVKRPEWSKEQRIVYTIDEAKRAGLTGKKNWKYPFDMLCNRVLGRACHLVFSDITRGFSTAEELEGISDED